MVETAKKPVRKRSARGSNAEPDAPPPRLAVEATPLRGRIPALLPAQAMALRGLFTSPQGWTLRDNGLLQFMPGKPAAAAETFEIDAEGTRIGLCLRTGHAATSAGLHWNDYEGRSRVLAWSLAHEAQLVRLSEAFGVVLTPLAEPTGPAEHEHARQLWLDFIVDEEPAAGSASRMPALQGALRVPPEWSERLLERADPPYDDTPPPLGRWRELPASVSIRLRIEPLPFADWTSLRPGDAIIVGRRSRLPTMEAQASGLAWPLAADAGGWRIAGAPRHLPNRVAQEAASMSENPTAVADATDAPAADPDALARQLPVDVTFEIGRSELRVGELSALQPGYVFPLAGPLEGANVTIRANGQAVGQGEVVAVGDTLGVRLLWWN